MRFFWLRFFFMLEAMPTGKPGLDTVEIRFDARPFGLVTPAGWTFRMAFVRPKTSPAGRVETATRYSTAREAKNVDGWLQAH